MDKNTFSSSNDSSQLQFQSFAFDSADKSDPPPPYDDNLDITSETAELLTGEEQVQPPQKSFWEFAYYQSFFNVDTDQVLNRVKWSMLPILGRATYLHRCIRPTPDLYGPFWICATLVFTIAVGGNIADYLHTAGQARSIWHYDFNKVSIAATTIYTYVFLVPLALWGFLWYRQSAANYTLAEIVCVYGYSLAIYIPVSVLCVLQFWWLQWGLVITGSILSGIVLLHTFWPAVKNDKKIAIGVLLTILLLHMLLAVGFLAYFFQPNSNAMEVIPHAEPVKAVTQVIKNLTVRDAISNETTKLEVNLPANVTR